MKTNLLFCLSFISQVFCNSIYERDVDFENIYIQDSSLYEISSTRLPQCALHCQVNETCLSFIYNRHDGQCQLSPKIFLSQLSQLAQTGNTMFKKSNGEPVCEVPPVTITKGRLLYIDGQKEGSKAQFICDDFYFPTILNGVCQEGSWTGLENPCVNVANPPYHFGTIGRVSPGRCVLLPSITPTGSARNEILLKKDSNNVAMSVKFDSNSEVIVRNSKINGNWGTAEQETHTWPLVNEQDVNLTICTENNQFRMLVDSVEAFTYDHRFPATEVTLIDVFGFIVKGIYFTE